MFLAQGNRHEHTHDIPEAAEHRRFEAHVLRSSSGGSSRAFETVPASHLFVAVEQILDVPIDDGKKPGRGYGIRSSAALVLAAPTRKRPTLYAWVVGFD